MKKILYLCDRNTYNSKMSRVRFHGIEKLGEVADVTWTGPSWERYNNSLSVQENIDQLFPNQKFDLVVAYNGKDLKEMPVEMSNARCNDKVPVVMTKSKWHNIKISKIIIYKIY